MKLSASLVAIALSLSSSTLAYPALKPEARSADMETMKSDAGQKDLVYPIPYVPTPDLPTTRLSNGIDTPLAAVNPGNPYVTIYGEEPVDTRGVTGGYPPEEEEPYYSGNEDPYANDYDGSRYGEKNGKVDVPKPQAPAAVPSSSIPVNAPIAAPVAPVVPAPAVPSGWPNLSAPSVSPSLPAMVSAPSAPPAMSVSIGVPGKEAAVAQPTITPLPINSLTHQVPNPGLTTTSTSTSSWDAAKKSSHDVVWRSQQASPELEDPHAKYTWTDTHTETISSTSMWALPTNVVHVDRLPVSTVPLPVQSVSPAIAVPSASIPSASLPQMPVASVLLAVSPSPIASPL